MEVSESEQIKVAHLSLKCLFNMCIVTTMVVSLHRQRAGVPCLTAPMELLSEPTLQIQQEHKRWGSEIWHSWPLLTLFFVVLLRYLCSVSHRIQLRGNLVWHRYFLK